jgi:23S rRNA (cytidine2498-2'-O)-methyltransferase
VLTLGSQRWFDAGAVRNVICTIKFRGVTDQAVVREFQAIPGGRVLHRHRNRHELTFIRIQET